MKTLTVWQRLLNWIAPAGYEDESGFHYGPERGSLNNPIVAGGVTHSWVRTCYDWPIASEQQKVISYSVSPLPSNTNASYFAIPDNTHGMVSGGTNYWAGFAAWPGLASERIPGLKMRTNYFTGGVQ